MAVTKEELAEYNKKRDKEEAFKKKQGEATEKAKSKAQEAKKQTGKKPWEIGTAPGEPGYISKEELDRRDKNRQKSKEADKEQRRKSYDAEQKKAQKSINKAKTANKMHNRQGRNNKPRAGLFLNLAKKAGYDIK